MNALSDAIDAVARTRKTIEIYADEDSISEEIARQFSTRNVDVVERTLPGTDVLETSGPEASDRGTSNRGTNDPGFVVLRDENGTFRAAMGIDRLGVVVAPGADHYHAADDPDTEILDGLGNGYDFLEETLFASYDRRQLLAATREIEDRAWRRGSGRLLVGFQTAAALRAQVDAYDRLAARGLQITVFIEDETTDSNDAPIDDSGMEVLEEAIDVIVSDADEIGRFWLLAYDGDGDDYSKCALLGEERNPDRYYGFWTYDPDRVDELIDYLDAEYDD